MKVAYLAPEIPALSATFVYEEILEVERCGLNVFPVSIHVPASPAIDGKARMLSGRTAYLYPQGTSRFLKDAFHVLLAHPRGFHRALITALTDAVRVARSARTSGGILFRFLAASTFSRFVHGKSCSHIHAHFAHVSADIAMYASLMTGIPFSFTAHANDIFVRGWLLREKVSRSAFAVAVSEFNRHHLVSHGAPADKIVVIHCGVDPNGFPCTGPTRPGKVWRIGSLGRMVEKKGFHVLVDACAHLKEKGHTFRLEIAGDGPMKEDLARRVWMRNLGDRITFIGALPHDSIPAWLQGLDLFVLPCVKDREGDMDGIPVVLMEAMLTGVPVVSTYLTGIPELIEDGVSGFLARPGEPSDLARAMERAMADEEVRAKTAGRASDRVRKDFNLGANSRTLAGLFVGGRP